MDRAEGRRRGSQAAGHVRTEDSFPDDLTAIRGIGMASQNRLYKAGIKTYAALASAEAAEVRRMLGNLANGAKVEDWIVQAQHLAGQG